MNKVSVIIIAKNEEVNIARCLESVRWANEIIVVDDGSSDRTVEVSKSYTEHVYEHPIDIDFNQNRNWALQKATGNWILFLDADERITPLLSVEITKAIDTHQYAGYFIPRKNYFIGQWIKGCGWYPDYIIRLFRKGKTVWPMEIHHTPKIESEHGRVGRLANPIVHDSYKSFHHYFEKFNRNTSRLALEAYENGRRVDKRNFAVCFFLKPCFWFLKKYLFWRGFGDGFRGLFICCSSALTIFTMYAKLWELQYRHKAGS